MMTGQKQAIANVAFALIAIGIGACALVLSSCSRRTLEDQNPAPSSSASRKDIEQFASGWIMTGEGRTWTRIAPTGSMAPFMDSHSVALWEVVSVNSNLRTGDVVVFDRGDIHNACHRILDENKTSVYMSGDNVRSDGWFPRSSVKMRLCGILYTDKQ